MESLNSDVNPVAEQSSEKVSNVEPEVERTKEAWIGNVLMTQETDVDVDLLQHCEGIIAERGCDTCGTIARMCLEELATLSNDFAQKKVDAEEYALMVGLRFLTHLAYSLDALDDSPGFRDL